MIAGSGPAGPETAPDYGQHWKEQERVLQYVESADQRQAERARLFMLMADLIPLPPDAEFQILDIGSGHGPVAAALLDAFPRASAVGLDLSEAMMAVGRERMARYGERFRYYLWDFAQGILPADLSGPFHVAVSAAALHHIPADHKRRLYRAVFERLAPGGCFFNLDTMLPGDRYLQERYRQARERKREREGEEAPGGGQGTGYRHFFEPIEDHLAWLTEAGFAPVDCFWKHLERALVGGYKRSEHESGSPVTARP